MKLSEVHGMAKNMLTAHGDRAEAEAAQKAVALEGEGKTDEAALWRRVQASISQMRGPRAS